MFSVRLPISYLSKPLGTIPCAPVKIGITVTLMFHSFLSSRASSKYFSHFSFSLIFTLWSTETSVSFFLIFNFFISFDNHHYFGSADRNKVISLYLKIAENFIYHIFQDRFWFVPVAFGNMIKFYFLAQSPRDHLPHPLVSSLLGKVS